MDSKIHLLRPDLMFLYRLKNTPIFPIMASKPHPLFISIYGLIDTTTFLFMALKQCPLRACLNQMSIYGLKNTSVFPIMASKTHPFIAA